MFDVVTYLDSFYIIDDPDDLLSETRRILRKAGWLAVELPGQEYILRRNYGWLPWGLDRRAYRAAPDSSYVYWYSRDGLERLLRRHGFTPTEWHVLPSPLPGGRVLDVVLRTHFRAARLVSGWSRRALDWAPKCLCLAVRD